MPVDPRAFAARSEIGALDQRALDLGAFGVEHRHQQAAVGAGLAAQRVAEHGGIEGLGPLHVGDGQFEPHGNVLHDDVSL